MTSTISCRALLRLTATVALAAAPLSASAASLTLTALDKNGDPMTDVVLYAEPTSGQAVPPLSGKEILVISQHDLKFDPYVTPLRVGTSVKFPNNDKFEHHVKSFSPAKEFQFKVYGKGGGIL